MSSHCVETPSHDWIITVFQVLLYKITPTYTRLCKFATHVGNLTGDGVEIRDTKHRSLTVAAPLAFRSRDREGAVLRLERVQQRTRRRLHRTARRDRFGFAVQLAIVDAGVAQVDFEIGGAR